MIRGRVNQNFEPVVAISILDSRDFAHGLDFILDTGFSGYLCLPSDTIRRLGLSQSGRRTITVADESRHNVDVYLARILFHERSRAVLVIELGDTPLLGMRMIFGSRLSMYVSVGGEVVIEEEM